jgi:hypothetical protein
MAFLIKHYANRIPLLEGLFVLCILTAVVIASGIHVVDILSALAGFLTFLCTQNAFDMNEALRAVEAAQQPDQHRYRNLFFIKEGVWILTFILLGNYPLLASTGVFASYPWWRRKLRSSLPQTPASASPCCSSGK